MPPYAVHGPRPARCETPPSSAAAAATLAAAAAANQAVVIRGAGTRDALGGVLRRADVELSTRGLNRVLEYHPADLTITVAAGLPLADLQAILGEHDQFLPLDPPEGGTVGGILAAAAAGPRRHAYGTPRDLVLGLEVALTSGDVIKMGGRTVKNVAGYDLAKLFIGSLGTLGLITAATLRVRPRPEASATVAWDFPDLARAVALVHDILDSDLLPAALVLVGTHLTILLEESAAAVADQEERLRRRAAQYGGAAAAPRPHPSGPVCLHGALPIAAALAFLATVSCPFVAYAGTGVFRLFPPADPDLIRDLRAQAENLSGHLTVATAPAELKAAVPVWGDIGPSLAIMRQLKASFDPQGILAPGRFL